MANYDNKKRIGNAFHRQAGQYDQYAVVQKRVVNRVDDLVASHLAVSPARLLDIGCGTGNLLAALHDRFPHAGLHGLDLAFNMAEASSKRFGDNAVIVNGDAENLPFRDCSFELVVSASTLQWIDDLDTCLRECLRVLMPGGLFCAAFFGGRTLWELQESYRQAVAGGVSNDVRNNGRLQHFKGVGEVSRTLTAAGFEQVAVDSELEVEYHPDVPHLLRAIKGVGAATPRRSDSGGGLGWRGVLQGMENIYSSKFQCEGKIPATYEVIYMTGHRSCL